jgi:hypothetical protein
MKLAIVIVTGVVNGFSAGCESYFRVTDPATRRVYYATEIRQDHASIALKDARTGESLTVQNVEVCRISKEEFEQGRASAPGVVASAAAPPRLPLRLPRFPPLRPARPPWTPPLPPFLRLQDRTAEPNQDALQIGRASFRDRGTQPGESPRNQMLCDAKKPPALARAMAVVIPAARRSPASPY